MAAIFGALPVGFWGMGEGIIPTGAFWRRQKRFGLSSDKD